jgi:hypothetical protein
MTKYIILWQRKESAYLSLSLYYMFIAWLWIHSLNSLEISSRNKCHPLLKYCTSDLTFIYKYDRQETCIHPLKNSQKFNHFKHYIFSLNVISRVLGESIQEDAQYFFGLSNGKIFGFNLKKCIGILHCLLMKIRSWRLPTF